MQAVEQAKWGSYKKAALGIHSMQITTEEEKIVENLVEDHNTETPTNSYKTRKPQKFYIFISNT